MATRMRFWAKQNWGERKLTIFSKPSLRRADGAEKSSFVLETRTVTGYYTSSDLLFQNKLAKLTPFIVRNKLLIKLPSTQLLQLWH